MSNFDVADEIIKREIELAYGREVTLRRIEDQAFNADIADSTQKFLVETPKGTPGFLLVSSAGNPFTVQRAVDNIEAAKSAVSTSVGVHILSPVQAGMLAGRTFGIWDRKKPFFSEGKLTTFIRNRLYRKAICLWLANFCADTLNPADVDKVNQHLQVITGDYRFSGEIRQAAESAAERLNSGLWQPKNCFHHGDFWPGNLLLAAGPLEPSFFVIDWGGMQKKGYPFIDLTRILMTLRGGPSYNYGWYKFHCNVLGCREEDIMSYLLSALGQLGSNLENFPIERFRFSAESIFRWSKSHLPR